MLKTSLVASKSGSQYKGDMWVIVSVTGLYLYHLSAISEQISRVIRHPSNIKQPHQVQSNGVFNQENSTHRRLPPIKNLAPSTQGLPHAHWETFGSRLSSPPRSMDEHYDETSLQTFHLFNDLPQELRDQIWEVAIFNAGDRIVEVRDGVNFTSTCPVPPLLHTCQSSRGLAMKRWKLSFAKSGQEARIFFDRSRDTLFFGQYFPNMDEFTDESSSSSIGVCHIAFSLTSQWGDRYESMEDRALRIHNTFADLKYITFTNRDLDFDFEAHSKCEPQPPTNAEKRAITFTAVTDVGDCSTSHRKIHRKFERAFEKQGWMVPILDRMNYRYHEP